MKDEFILSVEARLVNVFDKGQLDKLHKVLEFCLLDYDVKLSSDINELNNSKNNNSTWFESFLTAKKVEGCSGKTIKYYKLVIGKYLQGTDVSLLHVTTDSLRRYLADYELANGCSKGNIDNIRRVLSSFFSWLEEENYIIKNPMRRIHKIKTAKTVKETYSDECLEKLHDNAGNLRDLAIIDMLASTGIRVGELVRLNKSDIDFYNRQCIVLGKGNKERIVYFDAKTKLHLQNYLDSRQDDEQALFVSLLAPHKRLQISGVEISLRKLGRKLGINKVHPHKFRRTMATKAIDKGMPIEQVKQLLGHTSLDVTMEYALVNQENVKTSHKKYIC